MISKWNIINNPIRLGFAALPIVILEFRNYYPKGCNRSLNRGRKEYCRYLSKTVLLHVVSVLR